MTGVIAGATLLPTAVGAATPTLKDAFINFNNYKNSYSKTLATNTENKIKANKTVLKELDTKESSLNTSTNSKIKEANNEIDKKIKYWQEKGKNNTDPVKQTQIQYEIKLLEAERKRKDTELNLTERLEVEKINTQRKVILEEIESLESNHTENIGLISKVYSFFSPFKPTK